MRLQPSWRAALAIFAAAVIFGPAMGDSPSRSRGGVDSGERNVQPAWRSDPLAALSPRQAQRILNSGAILASSADASDPAGFYRVLGQLGDGDDAPSAASLAAHFPARGGDPVRFSLPDGFAVEVRETGLYGRGTKAGHAVAYAREGGTSYWVATEAGYEEWLLVAGGSVSEVASWVVHGGTLRQADDAVEILDAANEPRLRVAAPAAYREGGVRVATRLRADGNRLTLSVDLPSERFEEVLLVDPAWTTTTNMLSPRRIHTGTRLADGRVLLAGGIDFTNNATAAAEIYDPATEIWSPAGSLADPVRSHAAALLLDGRVLVSNGKEGTVPQFTQAEIYDPVTNAWTPADPSRSAMPTPTTRIGEKSVVLPDGNVLLTGNFCCPGNEAQIYDPVADQIVPVAPMLFHRLQHTLTLLPDGTVLATGGGTLNASALNSNTAEIYVPDTSGPQPDYFNGTWVRVGDMSVGHFDHSAVLLTHGPNAGNVLIATGLDGATSPGSYVFTRVCELYDPATQSFTPTGSVLSFRQISGSGNGGNIAARIEAGALEGHVVLAGGNPSTNAAEIYDPFSGTWSPLCDMQPPRLRHTTTALTNGDVLVAGGHVSASGQPSLFAASVLRPALDDTDCDAVPDRVDVCPGGGCGTVSGTVYGDKVVEDCAFNFGEPDVPGRMVRAETFSPNGGERFYAVTDSAGEYAFELPPGSYTLTLVPNVYTTESPACTPGPEAGLSHSVTVSIGSSSTGNDFFMAASCMGVTSVTGSGVPEVPDPCPNMDHYRSPCPGHPWKYCATYRNIGTDDFKSASPQTTYSMTLDPCMCFPVSGTVPDLDCTGGVVVSGDYKNYDSGGCGGTFDWTMKNGNQHLPPGESCWVCVEVDTQCISSPSWTTTATLAANCEPPTILVSDDDVETSQCSCDPNDKQVQPVGCGPGGFIESQDLTYTVRFQNIGAGPAHDVVIRDDLDPDLDVESLQVLASSHPITDVRVTPPRGLVVSFEGIELPGQVVDSAGSHGYVVFGVSPMPGLVDGTAFENDADIYFDRNAPVTTNPVVNTLGPAPTFGQTVLALANKVEFVWPNSVNYLVVQGGFATSADIGLYGGSVFFFGGGSGTSYIDVFPDPVPATGYWYLFNPDCPGASWTSGGPGECAGTPNPCLPGERDGNLP